MRQDGPQLASVPVHVAIIMDGNGRWAKERGLPRLAGHRAGTEAIRRVMEACVEFGIKILTLYAFSTENWSRPADEVSGLMGLLSQVIEREVDGLRKNGVRLHHVGSLDRLPPDLQQSVHAALAATSSGDRLTVNIALNYGGRAEIVTAARRMVEEGLPPDQITEAALAQRLYTAGQPDPDLIIRTAGEMRLSNFLIWQAAYSEFYATPVYWPDFGRDELYQALAAYASRTRKFGGLPGAAPGTNKGAS